MPISVPQNGSFLLIFCSRFAAVCWSLLDPVLVVLLVPFWSPPALPLVSPRGGSSRSRTAAWLAPQRNRLRQTDRERRHSRLEDTAIMPVCQHYRTEQSPLSTSTHGPKIGPCDFSTPGSHQHSSCLINRTDTQTLRDRGTSRKIGT